jgi:hypothetical protein
MSWWGLLGLQMHARTIISMSVVTPSCPFYILAGWTERAEQHGTSELTCDEDIRDIVSADLKHAALDVLVRDALDVTIAHCRWASKQPLGLFARPHVGEVPCQYCKPACCPRKASIRCPTS